MWIPCPGRRTQDPGDPGGEGLVEQAAIRRLPVVGFPEAIAAEDAPDPPRGAGAPGAVLFARNWRGLTRAIMANTSILFTKKN